jgi:Leucine-rich repeat (LRR) protein
VLLTLSCLDAAAVAGTAAGATSCLVSSQIRSLAPLSSLTADAASSPTLTELFVAANKVTAIEALGGFSQLTVLELGSNRVRTIEGLEVGKGGLTGCRCSCFI